MLRPTPWRTRLAGNQLVARRYERGSMILTSNLTCGRSSAHPRVRATARSNGRSTRSGVKCSLLICARTPS